MKRSGKLSVLTVFLSIIILVCTLFPLLKLDLSSVTDDGLPFTEQLQGVSGVFGSDDSGQVLGVSGKAVLFSLTKKAESLGSAGTELLLLVRILVLIALVSAVGLLIFGLISAKWAKILSLIFSAAGCIGMGFLLFWSLPSRLAAMIADKAGDSVSVVVTQITEGAGTETAAGGPVETAVSSSEIRSMILHGIKPALWVILAALVIALIVSFLRLIMKDTLASDVRGSAAEQPSFRCSHGPLAGEVIPFMDQGEISFGSDPSCSNMVIERSDLAPCHCRIRYVPEKRNYCVTVFENAPVILNGKPLGTGINEIRRGSEIFLGTGNCSIQLL